MKKAIILLSIPIFLLTSYLGIYWIWRYSSANTVFHGIVGAVIGAFFTLLLFFVAWEELGNISQTSSADFIHKLKQDFFTEKTRTLIHLIHRGYITFVEEYREGEKVYFFKVNEEKIKASGLPCDIVARLTKEKAYSSYDVDDLLLGHFEDVGFLENKGLINIEMAEYQFGWYIITVFENPEIKAYLNSQAETISPDIYTNFKYIYEKCKSFQKVKPQIRSIIYWKFKYKLCHILRWKCKSSTTSG
ncbi:MAG: hypothetical protein ABSG44_19175 [Thermodesulfobacteriota bacterium]